MINDGKRLKRGLKDLSPLFGQEKNLELEPSLKTAQSVQSLALFFPQSKKQNPYLSSRFASRLSGLGYECALLSLAEEQTLRLEGLVDRGLKRFQLTLNQFDEAFRSHSSAESFGSSLLLVDFAFTHPIQFKKVVPVLDKGILFLKPELESLTEAFKIIKASVALNPTLEHFVVCEGAVNSQKSGILFERFSEIVSRRMGISMNWLGCYDSTLPDSFSGLAMELLQLAAVSVSGENGRLPGGYIPGLRFHR